jgi:Putative transposase
VVTGGGLSADGSQWISCRAGFFLPVWVLSRLFRRLFLENLLKAFDAGKLQFFSSLESLRDRSSFLDYLAPLREAEWVVYAKRPFAGPEQVLDYVGRYTHRVAISNNRLLDIAEDKVTFRYKDYRERYEELTGCSLWQCPVCHKGRMLAIEILPRNHSRQTAITDTS